MHVGGRRIRGKAVAAAAYLALALGWGWATDHLIYFYAPDPIRAARLQTAEALLFYVVTTALIYFLISWYTKKVAAIRLELEADRRLRGLGEVAATIAHEFNNMLQSSQLSADVALRKVEPGSDAAKAVGNVRVSLARGTMLATKILRFTRPGAVTRQQVDFVGWLNNTAAEARAQIRGLDVVVLVPSGEISIDMDSALMFQAILNLLINARDAGATTVEIAAKATAKRVVLTVADDGPGIPASVRNQLFQPLVSTKPNGTGLGLSLVYFVVRSHDGEIDVLSDDKFGATFVITLPLSEKAPVSRSKAPD